MAAFNQGPKDVNDPSYLSYSKQIGDIPNVNTADKSMGILLDGIGDFISNATYTADTAVKQDLDTKIRSEVEQTRTQFEQEMGGSQYAQLAQPKPVDAGQKQGPMVSRSILPEDQPTNIPPDLNTLDGKLKTLAAYRDNGRASQTYYYGRLEALASEYRSRYGGHKDYIDGLFKKYTGVDPANAKLNSMIQDYNAAAAAAKTDSDKMETFLKSKSYVPGADVMYDM